MPSLSHYGLEQQTEDTEEKVALENAQKLIKNAWVAGVAIGILTFIGEILLSFISPAGPDADYTFMVIAVGIELAIIFGLTAGVYFKSRVCAILLFAVFCILQILSVINLVSLASASSTRINPTSILTRIGIVLYIGTHLVKGIKGSFTYHRLKSRQQ